MVVKAERWRLLTSKHSDRDNQALLLLDTPIGNCDSSRRHFEPEIFLAIAKGVGLKGTGKYARTDDPDGFHGNANVYQSALVGVAGSGWS